MVSDKEDRMILSSEQVADKLGLSINSIRVYAQKFGIGQKRAGRWFFSKGDMRVLEERTTKRGSPPKRG